MTRLKDNEIAVDRGFYKQMETALTESGWLVLPHSKVVTHYDHSDTHMQAALARLTDHLDALDEVIDAIGLRDAYQDQVDTVRHETFAGCPGCYPSTTVITRTDRGAQRFLDDVRAAKNAQLASEGASRLAAALKSAKAAR